MTATLTPHSSNSKGLARVHLDPSKLIVQELYNGYGNYDFDYIIHAVRIGYEDYRVIIDTDNFKETSQRDYSLKQDQLRK